jgi:hypothetical protein
MKTVVVLDLMWVVMEYVSLVLLKTVLVNVVDHWL